MNVRSKGGQGAGDVKGILSEEEKVVRLFGRVCLKCAMQDGKVARILPKRKCIA